MCSLDNKQKSHGYELTLLMHFADSESTILYACQPALKDSLFVKFLPLAKTPPILPSI